MGTFDKVYREWEKEVHFRVGPWTFYVGERDNRLDINTHRYDLKLQKDLEQLIVGALEVPESWNNMFPPNRHVLEYWESQPDLTPQQIESFDNLIVRVMRAAL